MHTPVQAECFGWSVLNSNGRSCLVMRLYGANLHTLIGNVPAPCPPLTLLRVCIDVAHGLAQMHARGTVHAGLSPSNVLLDELGSAFLADAGLGRHLRSTIATRAM